MLNSYCFRYFVNNECCQMWFLIWLWSVVKIIIYIIVVSCKKRKGRNITRPYHSSPFLWSVWYWSIRPPLKACQLYNAHHRHRLATSWSSAMEDLDKWKLDIINKRGWQNEQKILTANTRMWWIGNFHLSNTSGNCPILRMQLNLQYWGFQTVYDIFM